MKIKGENFIMATEVIEKATKTINVFIADRLSEDGIFPLRQETE